MLPRLSISFIAIIGMACGSPGIDAVGTRVLAPVPERRPLCLSAGDVFSASILVGHLDADGGLADGRWLPVTRPAGSFVWQDESSSFRGLTGTLCEPFTGELCTALIDVGMESDEPEVSPPLPGWDWAVGRGGRVLRLSGPPWTLHEYSAEELVRDPEGTSSRTVATIEGDDSPGTFIRMSASGSWVFAVDYGAGTGVIAGFNEERSRYELHARLGSTGPLFASKWALDIGGRLVVTSDWADVLHVLRGGVHEIGRRSIPGVRDGGVFASPDDRFVLAAIPLGGLLRLDVRSNELTPLDTSVTSRWAASVLLPTSGGYRVNEAGLSIDDDGAVFMEAVDLDPHGYVVGPARIDLPRQFPLSDPGSRKVHFLAFEP